MEGAQVKKRTISQPDDWWIAFELAASKRRMTISQWLGEAGRKCLPQPVKMKLSDRRRPGRPRRN